MNTLEELREKLKGRNYSEIAKKAGLTRSYVQALAVGKRLNPTLETINKINEALK